MDTHKRILGILFIVSGSIRILTMIFLSVFFLFFLPFIFEAAEVDEEWILNYLVPTVQIIVFLSVLFFAIPSIIAGIALLTKKNWGLTLALVLGCFKLVSFPIGTALGIYTIWVYSEDKKQLSTPH